MMSEGIPARQAALALLSRVLTKRRPLDAELPWRKDGRRLYPEVVELANEFGYV